MYRSYVPKAKMQSDVKWFFFWSDLTAYWEAVRMKTLLSSM